MNEAGQLATVLRDLVLERINDGHDDPHLAAKVTADEPGAMTARRIAHLAPIVAYWWRVTPTLRSAGSGAYNLPLPLKRALKAADTREARDEARDELIAFGGFMLRARRVDPIAVEIVESLVPAAACVYLLLVCTKQHRSVVAARLAHGSTGGAAFLRAPNPNAPQNVRLKEDAHDPAFWRAARRRVTLAGAPRLGYLEADLGRAERLRVQNERLHKFVRQVWPGVPDLPGEALTDDDREEQREEQRGIADVFRGSDEMMTINGSDSTIHAGDAVSVQWGTADHAPPTRIITHDMLEREVDELRRLRLEALERFYREVSTSAGPVVQPLRDNPPANGVADDPTRLAHPWSPEYQWVPFVPFVGGPPSYPLVNVPVVEAEDE